MNHGAVCALSVLLALPVLSGCSGGSSATTPSPTAEASLAAPSSVATSAPSATLDPAVVSAYAAMSDKLDEDTQPVIEQLLGGAGSDTKTLNEQVSVSFKDAAAKLRQIDLPADLDDEGTALAAVYDQFAAEYSHAAKDEMYNNATVIGQLQVRLSELDSAIRAALDLPALVTGA